MASRETRWRALSGAPAATPLAGSAQATEPALIHLRAHKEATTFPDLRAQANQLGAGTHLSLDEDTIVLEGITMSELNASMVLL